MIITEGELTKNIFVTIHSWREEALEPKYIDGMFGPAEIRQSPREGCGEVFQIKGICLPYVSCFHFNSKKKVTLDMRRVILMELKRDFVKAELSGIIDELKNAPKFKTFSDMISDFYESRERRRVSDSSSENKDAE